MLVLCIRDLEQQFRLGQKLGVTRILTELLLLLLVDEAADGRARDPKVPHLAVVGLHEGADRVRFAGCAGHDARAGARAAFEPVADHACAAARVAFGHGGAGREVDALDDVFGRDGELGDVVEEAVVCFCYDAGR